MVPSRLLLIVLFGASLLLSLTHAHNRLECPPSRSKKTGVKSGPCDASDDRSIPPLALKANALNTVTWLESISHPGAPARFALSLEGRDEGFESCILLDHVPHDDNSKQRFWKIPFQKLRHRSSITLWIPDVYCERCFLQLIAVMSDEQHGVPRGSTCAYREAKEAGKANASLPDCPTVYHSCAAVSIDGSIPRDNMTECDLNEFVNELDWPFLDDWSPSTYYWKGDPGLYSKKTKQLQSGGFPIEGCDNFIYCDPEKHYRVKTKVPAGAKYTALEGPCASLVDDKVKRLAACPTTPCGWRDKRYSVHRVGRFRWNCRDRCLPDSLVRVYRVLGWDCGSCGDV